MLLSAMEENKIKRGIENVCVFAEEVASLK